MLRDKVRLITSPTRAEVRYRSPGVQWPPFAGQNFRSSGSRPRVGVGGLGFCPSTGF